MTPLQFTIITLPIAIGIGYTTYRVDEVLYLLELKRQEKQRKQKVSNIEKVGK